jgi:hypothetical protein
MAGWNAITGARGIAAAFLMSALLQLGLVDVTSGLLLCAATSAMGVLLFARAGRIAVAQAPLGAGSPVASGAPLGAGSTKTGMPAGSIAPTR